MKYTLSGSLEIRLPEGIPIIADDRDEVINVLLQQIAMGEISGCEFCTKYLKVKKVRKVFTVRVEESFVNYVEIDTDEFPDIEDEQDAARYVEDNLDDFTDQFDYDYNTHMDYPEVTCDSYDTEEHEDEE